MQPQSDNSEPGADSDPSEIPPPVRRWTQRVGSGPPRSSLLSSVRPGRSLVWFPTAVAVVWATVIAIFVAVPVLFDTEEGASWAEGLGAVAGNFFIAWLVAFVVSAVMRSWQRR